jgi:AraC-type DNA-binding domain-containing proteins
MGTVTIFGDQFSTNSGEVEMGVRIVNHVTTSSVIRNRIVLQNYLFSLLVEGTKAVHTAHNSITIENNKFLLLLSGNYLMTEKIASSDGRFQSILISFTPKALHRFFSKYTDVLSEARSKPLQQVEIFIKDQFLNNFIDSLILMSGNGKEIPPALQHVKWEELLLYLCHHYPEKMEQLKIRAYISVPEIEMKKLVESNIGNNITLDELAFLCNLSLSTFKRKFLKLYGTSPSKWFLQKRMELATALLKTGGEKPSEIYFKVGYESHSSFTHSFKQVFGLTPTEYREIF